MKNNVKRVIRYIKTEFFPPPKSVEELELLRLQNLPRYTQTTTILQGNTIEIPDAASYLFMYEEIFKKEIYKFSAVGKEILIIDCGANIGLSIIYFKKLFPNASIIGFEPDAQIFNLLRQNIDSCEFENIKLYRKACWSNETTLKFISEGADAGRAVSQSEAANTISVETVRLKDFLNGTVSFLKMDIEGSEFEVLKDAAENLRNVENIFVEYHSFSDKEQMLPELLTILKNAGFRLHIAAPGLVSENPFMSITEYAGMDNQLNIFGFR